VSVALFCFCFLHFRDLDSKSKSCFCLHFSVLEGDKISEMVHALSLVELRIRDQAVNTKGESCVVSTHGKHSLHLNRHWNE
jgi:hypothetical protein